MKVFLGVHRFAANTAVEADMGWYPNYIKRVLNVLRYWNRMLCMADDRLTKKIFSVEHEQNKRGSWCSFVCNTFTKLGMQHLFLDKQMCDLTLCKTKLYECYVKEWNTNIKKKPKLRTYVEIKQDFVTEKYVKINLDRNQRSLLAQLRTGILPLNIETGRFSNTKLEERICKICNSGNIENEYHFLFHCAYFNDERATFINDTNLHELPNPEDSAKLSHLFENQVRKLAKYVCKIFKKRQDQLYQNEVHENV